MNPNPKRALTAALALVAALGVVPGCRKTEEARATPVAPAAAQKTVTEPADPPSPDVQAAVQGILDSGRHPRLTWPEVPGALPHLERLYAAEPDGLIWFRGESAHPAVAGALETLAHVDTVGLNPADYDALPLAKRWEALSAGPAPSSSRPTRGPLSL